MRSCCHVQRLLAALLASTYKMHVDLGHWWTHLRSGNVAGFGRRFDWHCGLNDAGVLGEMNREAIQLGIMLAVVAGGLLLTR